MVTHELTRTFRDRIRLVGDEERALLCTRRMPGASWATLGALLAGSLAGCAEDTETAPRTGVVTTDLGRVEGLEVGSTWSFKGIPYAAAPVGELRFRPPSPATRWDGVLEARQFGPPCPQDSMNGFEGDEDCLRLNVWTPRDPADDPLAVLVFLHGGSNVEGAASEQAADGQPIYDGAALAGKGAVVVTIDYRLGLLGFLAHPDLAAESDEDTSGNYGLLDQLAALDWVQRNVAGFGGDPGRVLLMGHSGGASDVCALIASPLSAGKLSSAAVQSGPCAAGSRSELERVGADAAVELGCADAEDVVACLRAASPEDLVTASWSGFAAPPYGIQVDGHVLPEAPLAALEEGSPVPLLVGTTLHEAGALSGPLDDPTPFLLEMVGEEDVDRVLAHYAEHGVTEPGDVVRAAYGDWGFHCPARQLARAAAAAAVPVRRYVFEAVLANGGDELERIGAFHGLDVLFLFDQVSAAAALVGEERYVASPGEQGLAVAMGDAWVRFAATGEPGPIAGVSWPAVEEDTDPVLEIGDETTASAGFRSAHCDLWDELSTAAR